MLFWFAAFCKNKSWVILQSLNQSWEGKQIFCWLIITFGKGSFRDWSANGSSTFSSVPRRPTMSEGGGNVFNPNGNGKVMVRRPTISDGGGSVFNPLKWWFLEVQMCTVLEWLTNVKMWAKWKPYDWINFNWRLRESSCLVLTGWLSQSPSQTSPSGKFIYQGKVRVEDADADTLAMLNQHCWCCSWLLLWPNWA